MHTDIDASFGKLLVLFAPKPAILVQVSFAMGEREIQCEAVAEKAGGSLGGLPPKQWVVFQAVVSGAPGRSLTAATVRVHLSKCAYIEWHLPSFAGKYGLSTTEFFGIAPSKNRPGYLMHTRPDNDLHGDL